MAERTLRRAGARWRLLVHQIKGGYGVHSHHIEPNPEPDRHTSPFRTHHELPSDTEFDELVVGRWLHIEQMDTQTWWMNIGGLVVHVTADRDGRPRAVRVDLEDPVDGCDYHGLIGIDEEHR